MPRIRGTAGGEPDPPFHHPVFVLTHHAREPLELEGGTTFTFVTDGIEAALEQARRAAGGKDVSLAGGAKAAQQYLAAGLVDEMEINLVPTLLGSGRAAVRWCRRHSARPRAGADGRRAKGDAPQVRKTLKIVEVGGIADRRTNDIQQGRSRPHAWLGLQHQLAFIRAL